MTNVSFVIPAYNHWELTHHVLTDISAYSPHVEEILILDNGSGDNAVRIGLEYWEKTYLPVRVLRVDENIGFIGICNWGVPQAEHENVVLISNDVRIKSDLANEVRAKLTWNNILGGVLYRGSTGWNEFDRVIYPYLEGWLLAFKKKSWEDLGGFDEDFAPFDYEDVDLSTSAINMGYTLEQLEGNYEHLAAQTIGYNPERLKVTERNREIFREKWINNADSHS